MKSEVSWSLQLKNKEANIEFEDFLRAKARANAKVIIVLKAIIAAIGIIVTIKDLSVKREEESVETGKADNAIGKHFPFLLAVLLGPASLCMAIVLCISYKKPLFAELFIPVELTAYFIALILIFNSGMFSDAELL